MKKKKFLKMMLVGATVGFIFRTAYRVGKLEESVSEIGNGAADGTDDNGNAPEVVKHTQTQETMNQQDQLAHEYYTSRSQGQMYNYLMKRIGRVNSRLDTLISDLEHGSGLVYTKESVPAKEGDGEKCTG